MAPTDFSIITPTLNADSFIRDCLMSIRQCFQDFSYEHIIVDGGSQDTTKTIVEENKDHSVRWIQASGSSMYEALNQGISESSGRILYQLNADDLAVPHAPAVAVAALDAGADLLTGACATLDLHLNTAKVKIPLIDQMKPVRLTSILFISQPSTYVSASALKSIGGYPVDYRYAGDTALWLKMQPPKYQWAVTTEILAIDRLHAASARLTNQHIQELREVRSSYQRRNRVRDFSNAFLYLMRQARATSTSVALSPGFELENAARSWFATLFSGTNVKLRIDVPCLHTTIPLQGRVL